MQKNVHLSLFSHPFVHAQRQERESSGKRSEDTRGRVELSIRSIRSIRSISSYSGMNKGERCDIIYKSNGDLLWNTMAHYSLAAGVIGGLLAALPGLIDLMALPSSHAKRIGLWHLGLNLGITGLYIANFFWRRADPAATGAVALSVLAIVLLVVSGWLGGEMVYVHGVAVAPADETGAAKKHPA